jgi:hypothetical protein
MCFMSKARALVRQIGTHPADSLRALIVLACAGALIFAEQVLPLL